LDGASIANSSRPCTQSCVALLLRRRREMILVAGKSGADLRCAVHAILQQALQLRARREQGQISESGLALTRGRMEARLDRSLQRGYHSLQNQRLANHLLRVRDPLFAYLT
jgi:hypothetical protein